MCVFTYAKHCMHAYMRYVLRCKYSFVALTTVNDIIEKPGGNAVEYYECRHIRKCRKQSNVLIPKLKRPLLFAHQFNIYRKIKIIASPRLDSFCNMQENKR